MNEISTHPEASRENGRILVLEPEANLASEMLGALREAAPAAQVNVAKSLEEAQRLVMSERPDLFVLDVDAVPDLGQEFLYDLRTSHPNARAIVLTGVHLAAHRERAAGLGAIHFLEKPFPHGDFIDLVQALLSPASSQESEKFQGTLSDLHLADIIQLKCMSGSSAALQFTGPQGEKARVYFESGQVRHATAPGKEGVAAFNEIVNWKGGQISEVSGGGPSPRTIDLDWQILLMEAVRKIDEERDQSGTGAPEPASSGRKILVIDDSLMLLSFVKEILSEANYQVVTAPTAEEGLAAAAKNVPDLVLLDYVLPDMTGDEVTQRMAANSVTSKVSIVYMSGFGADLPPGKVDNANVIGSLNKPFTSELLLQTVEKYMSKPPAEPVPAPVETQPAPAAPGAVAAAATWQEPEWPKAEPATSQPEAWSLPAEPAFVPASDVQEPVSRKTETNDAWWSPPISSPAWPEQQAPREWEPTASAEFSDVAAASPAEQSVPLNGTFFSGDTSFFSLNGALHTIGKHKLTGTLRSFWDKEPVELLAQKGRIILVTTRDPELYCSEAPITLVSVNSEQTSQARATQRETACPLFLTLVRQGLVLREPAVQLVHHYGQKLFAELWTARRVRFAFEQSETLPDFAQDIPGEEDIDHWILSTLRCIQFQQLSQIPEMEAGWIPAYTRDGFERVQKLRLTVAEAQFASQFNGARSLAQIAKNLRIDFSFARLTLFRFLALEIVECWPPTVAAKQESRGMFQRLGRSIGLGD